MTVVIFTGSSRSAWKSGCWRTSRTHGKCGFSRPGL